MIGIRALTAQLPLDHALLNALIAKFLLIRECLELDTETLLCAISSSKLTAVFFPDAIPTTTWERVNQFTEDQLSGCPAQILGSLYEASLSIRLGNRGVSHTQLEGIYYTPQLIVEQMVETSMEPTGTFGRVLDPACGSGAFLVETLRLLSKKRSLRSYREKTKVIECQLVGIDKDSAALKLCKAALLIEALSGAKISSLDDLCKVKFDLRQGDFLLDQPLVSADEKFSLIIGNPPYGLSREGRLSLEENKRLKSRFKEYLCGKPNKYLLFLSRGIELLRTSDTLTFIIPNSWLGIDSGRRIRELILGQHLLSELIIYQGDVFGDPGVEAVTLILKRNLGKRSFSVSRIDSKNLRQLAKFELLHEQTLNNPDSTIPTVWNDELSVVFAKLDKCCTRIGAPDSPFEPRIALQAYAAGKGTPAQSQEDVKNRIFDRTSKEDSSTYPYLDGKEIDRFKINWGGGYLKHGEFLAEPQIIERFVGPRILIREILGSTPYLLIATYTESPYLYNKSVLHILPKNTDPRLALLTLCGILNSKLASFFIKFRGKKSQRRLFPKIVNSDLKQMLIPKEFCDPEIAGLTDKLLCHSGDKALQERLDKAVYKAYFLSNSDVEIIEQSLL